jgi:peptide/nickel transport system substrate-binding protein
MFSNLCALRRHVLGAALVGGSLLLLSPLAQAQSGDMVIGLATPITSLDPHFHNLTPNNGLGKHVFENLVVSDEFQNLKPGLAESWKALDTTTWEFKLRKGVKWHDGTPFTADDVIATFKRVPAVPNSPASFALFVKPVIDIRAADAHTLIMKTAAAHPLLPRDMTSVQIIPKSLAEAKTEDFNSGKAMIGTGPYKFVEYKPDSHVKLARFDDYVPNPAYKERDGFAGAKIAYLDTVTFRFIPEAGARDAATMTGQVHLNETSDETTAKRLKGNPNFTVMKALPYAVQVLKFNMAQGPGTDLNFRRAIAQAINAEEILGTAYPDLYLMDQSWVYPGSPYHTGRALLKQDVAAAKANLAKSSYKGEKLIFIIDNIRPNVDAATVFQQQVAAIGVNVELKVGDWPTISGIGLKSDQGWNFWTHGFGIEPYEGPASAMSHWVKGQGQRKDDPVIDELFAKLNGEMDVAVQKKLFADFENRMADQAIAINLGDYGLFQVVSNKLKNFKPYRITRMWGVWLE